MRGDGVTFIASHSTIAALHHLKIKKEAAAVVLTENVTENENASVKRQRQPLGAKIL
jgi:hypothetical protein